MRKSFYTIVRLQGSKTVDILIYGIIGEDYYSESITAKNFVRDFKQLETQYSVINIRINSPGGSVWDGLAIFNCIRASKAETHTYNDGICFSMAAIILLAGKTIHLAKGSLTMLHNASGGAGGNAQDMRDTAEMLDKHDNVLIEMIADRSGKTEDEVKAEWMDYKDHFLTSKEMLDGKLADVIDDYDAKDMPEGVKNLSVQQITAFYSAKMDEPSASFIEKITEKVTAGIKNLFPTKPSNNLIDMNFPKITAFALLAPTARTEANLTEATAELKAIGTGTADLAVVTDVFVAEAVANKANVTRLTNELAAANTAKGTLETEKTALEAKLAAGPAAVANPVAAADPIVEPTADQKAAATLAGFAHNKHISNFLNGR